MIQIFQKLALLLNRTVTQYNEQVLRVKHNIPSTVYLSGVSIDGNVSIGEYTYINDFSRIDTGTNSRILIGKHCAIGRFVHITSKTHDPKQPTTDEFNVTIPHIEKDIFIGDYVWIGDKVTVLPGVRIGDYAILAAHAVVTKDVEPFEIVGGVPAKHIRYNTNHYKHLNTSK